MQLLSLDFDGCLHRASDSVLINFRPNAPAWEMEIALKAQRRFLWACHLAPLLEHTDIAVLLHSTWRKRFSDTTLKQFLPPEIGSRVICLDGQIKGREVFTSDEYIAAALDLIAPTSVCIVDDRPELFASGKARDWMDHNHGRFVWCLPDSGVQDLRVRSELSAWAAQIPPDSSPTHNFPHPIQGV